MKLRIIYGLMLSCILYSSVLAQDGKVKFHSIENGGVIIGESEANAVFQTVNGISVHDWFLGVGVGVDYYQYKTLPLFFDARNFFGKNHKWFLYGNLGYDFPLHDEPGMELGSYNYYHVKGGVYADFGIGIRTKFINKTSLLFSLGHSYKQLQFKTTQIIPLCSECKPQSYYYTLGYGRISFKAGLEF